MRTLLSLLIGLSACGAGADATQNSHSATGAVAVVPFQSDDNLMLLPVEIGGQREWFVFDSGASHSVIDPRLVERLGLRRLGRDSTTGTGAGAVGLEHVEPVTLGLGDVRLRVEDPWEIDLSGVPIRADVRGLVGAELWKRYVVRTDPVNHTLSMFEPATFRPRRGDTQLPLIVEGDRLFLNVRLDVRPGLSVTHKVRIDTGENDSVNDAIVGQSLETRVTTLGNGLGRNYQAVSGRMQAVHLGPHTVRNVWGPGGDRPSIGMELLRRFVVTFDAPHRRLYLRPTRALAEPVPAPGAG